MFDLSLKQKIREFIQQRHEESKQKMMSVHPMPIIIQAHESEKFIDDLWVFINKDQNNETAQ